MIQICKTTNNETDNSFLNNNVINAKHTKDNSTPITTKVISINNCISNELSGNIVKEITNTVIKYIRITVVEILIVFLKDRFDTKDLDPKKL